VALVALTVTPVTAQPVPGQEPGIVAVGFGSASAPAATATLQFLLGSSQAFGMGGEVVFEEAPVCDEAPVGEGTPGPEATPPDAMGGMDGPPTLTEDQLAPVVDALVAAGASETDITVVVPAASQIFGPGGPGAGEIRVVVDQPQSEQLRELVQAAYDTAPGAGLSVLYVGARYAAADCAVLLQEAREAAIADAQTRAEGLARGLDVTLGDLVQASETPYFGLVGGGSCAPEGTENIYGYYGPGMEAPFDPTATEATTTIQVTLTFAIEATA